ncbi:hypothetical protein D3C84_195990 [compost metagenome]
MNFNEWPRIEFVQRLDFAGLGQGVPLVLQAAGVEHERKGLIGHFGGRQVRTRQENTFAVAGRECDGGRAEIGILVDVANRIAIGVGLGRARPLQRFFAQTRVAGAANVITGGRVPGTFDFFKHFAGVGISEGFGEAHRARHSGDDLPVGQRFAGRFHGFLHQCQVALGVDHHAFGFGPECARQQDVGVAVGLGIEKGILGDDQFSRL